MKQQKRWRRWFRRRNERIEITHETHTRILVRQSNELESIPCPNCGMEVTLAKGARQFEGDAYGIDVLAATPDLKGGWRGGQNA